MGGEGGARKREWERTQRGGGRQKGQAETEIGRRRGRHADKPEDREREEGPVGGRGFGEIVRHTDRQAHRQTGRQTDKQKPFTPT